MIHFLLRTHLLFVSIIVSFVAAAQSPTTSLTPPDSVSATLVNNNVVVTWRYTGAESIDGFRIERSINGTNSYSTIAKVAAGARSFIDASFINNSVNNYRVRSIAGSAYSNFSNSASVSIGNAPFAMRNGTFTICGANFYDPGGQGNYNGGNYTTTLRPSNSEGKVRISFSELSLGYGDYLNIYNGPSASSALLGSYSGNLLPPVLESTAPGGELTFVLTSTYSNGYPGWKAFVTCFKPLAAPDRFTAKDSLNVVRLKWSDNANDETGYQVEKSINDSLHFSPLTSLPANASSYEDTSGDTTDLRYYRVRATRDTAYSIFATRLATTGPLFSMKNGTVTTCDLTFLDPGGFSNSAPGNYVTTIRPSTTGNSLKVAFKEFNLYSYENLTIYNGPSTSSPFLGSYSGISKPPVLVSTAPGGELTFAYSSYYATPGPGWTASLTCYKTVSMPTGVAAHWDNINGLQVSWTDNATDETGYTLERSLSDSFHFVALIKLPANSTSYKDTSAPKHSRVFYRVKAYRDSISSPYSATVGAINANSYVMQNGTVSLCDAIFLDPGGLANYTRGNYTTTISPSAPGNNVQVKFTEYSSSDNLYVYNGPSANSPFLGSYSSWNAPTTLKSTAPGGELTFVFNAYSDYYSGWVAYVSCFKPVSAPSAVKAKLNPSQQVALSWTDNADNEKSFVIERAVNGLSAFTPVARLDSNTTEYIDTAAPANSFLYYRVRAYGDSLVSLYSDTATMEFGNVPYLMKAGSPLITCDKVFMDPAGADVLPHGNYYNIVSTFSAAIRGNNLRVAFSKFRLSGTLYVYDGSSTISPLIGQYNGYHPTMPVFKSTSSDGSLTFVYQGYSSSDSGWVAQVSCYKPVPTPTNVKATTENTQGIAISWTDNANDETKYVVERSVNAPTLYTSIAQLPSNTATYTDHQAPANSLLYYRVIAFRDTLSSFYSDTATVTYGNAPFMMKDSTLITCDKVFMDPGGAGIIPSSSSYYNLRTTFKPGIDGYKTKVSFEKFSLYNGGLYIYDGPSSSSPLIAGYRSGFNGNPGLLIATGPTGSLTFEMSGYANSDTGWIAQIGCYKPVAKPSGIKALAANSQSVELTWSDNADNETKYVVERSVNGIAFFKPVMVLAANTTQYTDSAAPLNSLLYYRVKAYQDTLGSFYSDTASIGVGNAPFLMKDTTLITCDKVFMDPGGAGLIQRSYNLKTTFKPAIGGNNISVAFRQFSLLGGNLTVYDGPSVSSPLIGRYSTGSSEPIPRNFKGTGPDGSLTFAYEGYGYNDSGWVAEVSCYKPVAKPSRLQAIINSSGRTELTWIDNADDDTKYVIERSVNAPSLYSLVAELPANTTSYTDSSAPAYSHIFYRVRAFRDTLGSFYSDTASVAVADAPFLMKDTTIITCDKVFTDPGGTDVIRRFYYTRTTFKSANEGNKIRVVFSKFRINGSLYVYNGSSTGSPLIGRYDNSYSGPLVFNSTAEDGALTFQLQASADSGWVANVSCYKPVATPSGLKAVQSDLQRITLTWVDNAEDETKYVVERSVNGISLFRPIVQLQSNTSQYIDNTSPPNSKVYYRVIAYRDTLGSLYSNIESVAVGNIPFLMRDSTLITCSKEFMDAGGADVLPWNFFYPGNNIRSTFKPAVEGNKLKVTFSKFHLNGALSVYDGPSQNSPLLATLSSYNFANTVFKATNAEGSLTFVYSGYSNGSDSGWVAQISCFKPVAAPGNLTIDATDRNRPTLNWTDNANNESGYIVERSTTDSLHYQPIIKLPANSTSYVDTAAPANSFMYYRVASYIDTSNSDYSNAVSVVTGVPFIMQNSSTVTTCGVVFLDPGGLGNYNSGYYTTTVKPAIAGNVVRAQFSEFSIDGSLTVYNGPSSSSPYLASYYGSSMPPVLQSTAPGGELTFVFSASYPGYYPGWIARLSCFKPVLRPTDMKATINTSGNVSITWKDNAEDETSYVVERSVNAPSLFEPLAQLDANSVQYTDTAAPPSSILYYRVRAYRDTTGSFYSDVANVAIADAPLLMKDTTLITCNKVFMDPGGLDVLPPNTYYSSLRTTFKPAVNGNNIMIAFDKLKISGGYLYVYDGPSASSPQIGFLNYYSNSTTLFRSTAPDGSLTVVYSGSSNNDSGWLAQVSCYKPVAKPSGLTAIEDSAQNVRLNWTDNENDETKYVVERSVNGSPLFTTVGELPSNTTHFIDSTAPTNSLLYYRIRAFRDDLGSHFSDVASVGVGNAPFLMRDSTLITCDKVFMDPAGDGLIPVSGNSVTTTLKPTLAGNKIRVTFSKFRLNGYLYVYNGPTESTPILGVFSSYYSPPVLNSTAPDGSLTFRFQPSSYYQDSGWEAHVSCYKPVTPPSGLNATVDTTRNVTLSWLDNANNEAKYVVERSINAPSQYRLIAQLPANTTQYYDSTAPKNGLVFYRLRAYQDSSIYVSSNTASVEVGQAPFLMADSTVITCNKMFMDAGGTDVIPNNFFIRRTTFKPATSGNKVRVAFSRLAISGTLSVYDGLNENSPRIGNIYQYTADRTPVFTATGADGALTFVYQPSYSSDSGWVAQVSCYTPVLKPTHLNASVDSAAIVKLRWTDNATDETRYVVERSINASSMFATLATLPANASEYADSTAPSNSTLSYRVRAYRDTAASMHSDTATALIGDGPFLMQDTTLITCGKVFMDPGGVGVTAGFYRTITTFRAGIDGNNIKVAFSKIGSSPLYVYNGSSINSPFIGLVPYQSNRVFHSTAADGALTFVYYNYGYLDSGWVADVSCFKRVETPTNLAGNSDNTNRIHLNWTDNAGDETSYQVERSFNDSLHFSRLSIVPANTTSYTDNHLPLNTLVFYRVRAMRDTIASAYSNSVSIFNGNEFTMRSGNIKACGITFLDPGGKGNYSNNVRYTTTFTSPSANSKVKVLFNSFNTESCCDYLTVYNGPDSTYPLLGIYIGNNIPKVLESTAPNGELTFVFTTDASNTGTGWNATISCAQPTDTITNCSTDSNDVTTISTTVAGSSYQWQKFNGKDFVNIDDDLSISGAATSALKIKNAALTVIEAFRCLVDGGYSQTYVVLKGNNWIGNKSNDWHDPQNWSCEKVPDGNTDVLIEGGRKNNPVLSSHGDCRSIQLLTGANLQISAGVVLTVRH